ncbi:MAG: tail fiber domain-containing protein [Planctomycetota bacterium]
MQLPTTARVMLAAAGLAAASVAGTASAQTALTYQGVLEEGGSPVTGLENIRFRIFDAQTGGTLFGETTQNVDVEDGVFSAELNFGPLNLIDPNSAWLEIAVNTGSGFETLGRQRITSAPFSTNTRGMEVEPSGQVSFTTDSPSSGTMFVENTSTTGFAGTYFIGPGGGLDGYVGVTSGGPFTWIGGDGMQIGSATGQDVIVTTGAAERMRVTSSGNVGIGTDTPDRALNVVGGVVLDNPSENGWGMFTSGSDSRFVFRREAANGTLSEAATVLSNGNVGIGTASPSALLSLQSPVAEVGSLDILSESLGNGDVRYDGGSDGDFFIEHAGDASGSTIIGRTGGQRLVEILNNGRIGVGTSMPQFPVTIQGDGSGGSIGVRSSTGGSGYHLDFNGSSLSIVESGDKIRATFLDDDRLAIGPNFGFTNVGVNINLPFTFGLLLEQGDAGKPGGGSWASTSDKRLKTNIHDLEGALDTLLALRGVTYEYKNPDAIGELQGTRTGFIAQEAEEVIPDWVWDAEDGYKRMTIRGFEAMAVEAIRELKAEKDAEIAALETRLESLESQRSVVGASMVWPVLLGGGLLGGLAVARRRQTKIAGRG